MLFRLRISFLILVETGLDLARGLVSTLVMGRNVDNPGVSCMVAVLRSVFLMLLAGVAVPVRSLVMDSERGGASLPIDFERARVAGFGATMVICLRNARSLAWLGRRNHPALRRCSSSS